MLSPDIVLKAKQEAAILDKVGQIFNMDLIQNVAALQGKLSDDEIRNIEKDKEFLINKFYPAPINIFDNLQLIDGYTIQKSGRYEWHTDSYVKNNKPRYLTFIWYLNTRNFDGETDFVFKKVKPEEGKLIIFPSSWELNFCAIWYCFFSSITNLFFCFSA